MTHRHVQDISQMLGHNAMSCFWNQKADIGPQQQGCKGRVIQWQCNDQISSRCYNGRTCQKISQTGSVCFPVAAVEVYNG